MTITVSIEELRDFELQYKVWATKCDSGMFVEAFRRLSSTESDTIRPLALKVIADVKLRQADWLAQNPEPKLIPSI